MTVRIISIIRADDLQKTCARNKTIVRTTSTLVWQNQGTAEEDHFNRQTEYQQESASRRHESSASDVMGSPFCLRTMIREISADSKSVRQTPSLRS